jgi:eukaryotic-like serine/threonine-protein kinase
MKKIPIYFLVSLAVIISGCASTLKVDRILHIQTDDRITLGGSNKRTNFVNESIKLPIQKVWTYQGAAGISPNQPLIADSIIFIGFLNGDFHAINLITGKRIGRLSADAAVDGCPVMTKDKLYIPIAHNKFSLKAYDFDEGILLWKKEIDGIESSLILQNNILYAASENGSLYAINTSSGKTIWEFKSPKQIHSSIASDSSKIFFGCDDGYLYAIKKETGSLIWKFFTGGPITGVPSIDDEGNIYIGSTDNYFYCIKTDNGFMKWKFNSGSEIESGSAVDAASVYFGNLSGDFFALNKTTGNQFWKFKAGNIINCSPTITNEHVVFGCYDRKAYILEKESGNVIWSEEFDGRVKTTPIIWKNYLLICSEDYDITLYKF